MDIFSINPILLILYHLIQSGGNEATIYYLLIGLSLAGSTPAGWF